MQAASKIIEPEFIEDVEFVFDPYRFKVLYGGRGGVKSWTFARALLIKGAEKKLRILCTREVQRSIKDSVHKLLKDQVELLGLGSKYAVLDNTIRGRIGTEFIFAGLSTQTAESIKSYEGVDIVWAEEAQVIKKRSWDILIPTIRKTGSEIWISFNPELESDETYKRFITNIPENSVIKFLSYRDNPWFSNEMEQERLRCKRDDPDGYENIWEGKCRPAVAGAIFYKEIQRAEIGRRICNVPYDPMLKVHLVFDVGYDALGCALVQKLLSEIRIIEYIEADFTELTVFSAYLKQRPYNWGRVWLPHDAFAKRIEARGISTYKTLKSQGWDVVPREQVTILSSVEEGIRVTRTKFGQMYFDKTKTNAPESPVETLSGFNPTDRHWRLIESLKRYKRHVNENTEVVGEPVRDPSKHGGDVVRYIALNADNMLNETSRPRLSGVSYTPLDAVIGY